MGRTSGGQQLPDNLPMLQNLIKRDAESYQAEFVQQYRRYEANLQVFLLQPSENSKQLSDLVMFTAQVSHCYPELIKDFPQQIREVLQRHATVLYPEVRMNLCRALMLLRNKQLITPASLYELFFELFRCQDKALRSTLYSFIVQDIKNLNTGSKNNKLNKTMQNFMYTMLSDSNATAVKMSLSVMIDLYLKKIWNDAKTVNVISTACFSKFSKVLAIALKFFMTQENESRRAADSDSDSEEDGPTARDIIIRFAVNKKTTRQKKKHKKALKKLNKRKSKKKKGVKAPNVDFSALHLLHDPQGFSEKLFQQLQKSTHSFELRLMMIIVVSRVVGVHKLILFNLYPFLQRFLQPHQREVTKILLAVAQASHDLVPPEIIKDVVMTVANNFVTERNSTEVMAVGINAIREICARCPLAMTEDLLRDLTLYQKRHGKTVMAAARSLVQLFKRTNPNMLHRKDRGRFTEARKELATISYGEVSSRGFVAGSEILPEEPPEPTEGNDKDGWVSCSDESDCDGSWIDVSSDEDMSTSAPKVEDLEPMDEDEKVSKSTAVSQTRLFTQEEFQLISAHQANKEFTPASRNKGTKRKMIVIDENMESIGNGEIIPLGSIEHVIKKKPHDKESRMAMTLASREGREKFGRRKTKLDPYASTTNKQKNKNKPFMMVRDKMKKKSGRSFREKQVALRNALLKKVKHYK